MEDLEEASQNENPPERIKESINDIKIGAISKNIHSSKNRKMKINKLPFNLESFQNKIHNNNKANTINDRSKYFTNTYKTFSEISTNKNEIQKIDTTINSTFINTNYHINNNFLIIEDIYNSFGESKNKRNKVHKGNEIFNGETLYFDTNGLKYGLRGKKDGYGFFGTSTHFHGKIINDYVLNIKNDFENKNNDNIINIDKNDIPIVYFVIYYEKENKKYYLKNVRKINYNNLESFIFSFAIYKGYISNNLRIIDNIIICFNENKNYVLALQPQNNFILRTILLKIDEFDNRNNNYNKSKILYKGNIENNGVTKIIGNKGNIKIDLKGKNYLYLIDFCLIFFLLSIF